MKSQMVLTNPEIKSCLLLFCTVILFACNPWNKQTFHPSLSYYPYLYPECPELSSPASLAGDTDVIIVYTHDENFAVVPVTIENRGSRDYRAREWNKGRQLDMGCPEFSALTETGRHKLDELKTTLVIGGKSVDSISEDGRPGGISHYGFMAEDEDLISVLTGDQNLVDQLRLTHRELAAPLFHVFNLILEHRIHYLNDARPFEDIEYIRYNHKNIYVTWGGAKGWQNSIFNDDNLGYYFIDLERELSHSELQYLQKQYSHLSSREINLLINRLSKIHTGEMVPYYIMRYGFYEGHTEWRADPVAISFVFNLIPLRELDGLLNGNLYSTLTEHYTVTR